MNDYFLPRGSIEFGKLSRKLVASTPALELRPWSSKRYKDVTVVTGDMVGSRIKDLLIFDRSEEGSERVISAGEAGLVVDEKRGDVVLEPRDVWQQTVKKGETDRFEWARASTWNTGYPMREQNSDDSVLGPRDMPSVDFAKVIADKARPSTLAGSEARRGHLLRSSLARGGLRRGGGGSLSLAQLRRAARARPRLPALLRDRAPEDRTLQVYKLEYFKKFSIPFGALFFVVLAFPLGLLAKKSGRTMGFGIGILVSPSSIGPSSSAGRPWARGSRGLLSGPRGRPTRSSWRRLALWMATHRAK
jgi:lipopolysaccharide export system permease protein